MAKVIAVVLAGGTSRRMGGDKRTLRLFPASATFLERTVAVGRASADRTVVLGGSSVSAGASLLPDRWPGEGPLGALVTAIEAFPEDHLLLLACDYPMLQVDLIARIVEAIDGHDAAVAVEAADGRRHPLIAAYDAGRCGSVARTLFEEGGRSMGVLLDRASVRLVGPVDAGDREAHALSLANLNTRDELEALRGRSLALDRHSI